MKRVIAREKGADQNALLKLPSCKFLDHQSDRSVQCKYLRNLEKSLEPRNPFARFSDSLSSGKCPSPPASAMNGPTSIGSASSLPPRHSEAPTQSCFLQCRSSGARASDQGAELDIHQTPRLKLGSQYPWVQTCRIHCEQVISLGSWTWTFSNLSPVCTLNSLSPSTFRGCFKKQFLKTN